MNKKRLSRKLFLITLALSALLFLASGSGCGKKAQVKEVKIALVVPMTGPISFIGQLVKQGIELAKEDVNSKSKDYGFTLKVLYGDNKGQTKESISIVQRYLNVDKAKFFLVSPTPSCLAVAPIIDKARVIMFAGSTHPYITDKSNYIFRTCASNAEENELLTKYSVLQGYQTAGALYVEDDFGQSAIKYFKDHFRGKVIAEETYNIHDKDFRQQILKLQKKDPDIILIEGYGIAFPSILKQMAELGIEKPILGNLGFSNPPVQDIFKILPQNFTKKIVFSSPRFSEPFSKLTETKFSKQPNLNQAFAYDFIKIVASEIKKNGFDTEKIKESILKIKDYSGAFKNITFLPNGDSRSVVRLMRISDGKIVPMK